MAPDESPDTTHRQIARLLDELIERLRAVLDAAEDRPTEALRLLRQEFESLRSMRAGLGATASAATALPEASKHLTSEKLGLLAVTSDAEVTQLLERAGSRFGLELRSVTTTAAALRLVDELSPDIVAFDLCSSVSGERDLMTELRAKNHRPMPIGIAISAGGSGQSAEAMKAGYHSFLVKPLTLESTSTALATANRLLLRRSARSTKTREKKR